MYYFHDKDVKESKFVSVTGFIDKFFPKFDPSVIIGNMRKKKKMKKIYRGLTDHQIRDSWTKLGDESRRLGTIIHEKIEQFYEFMKYRDGDLCTIPEDVDIELSQFNKFHERKRQEWTPYRSEWRVYLTEPRRIAGTIDMVYVVSFDRFESTLDVVIVDWKRSKKIKKFACNKGIGPCGKINNSNYFKYSIQLSMYKHMLENAHGFNYKGITFKNINVVDMFLVVMHPSHKCYKMFKCVDFTCSRYGKPSVINQMLNHEI